MHPDLLKTKLEHYTANFDDRIPTMSADDALNEAIATEAKVKEFPPHDPMHAWWKREQATWEQIAQLIELRDRQVMA